jgi:hypothetical protein
MYFNDIKTFATSEDGAVTVDWVVLTAAIVGIGIGVILQPSNSTSNVASRISDCVANRPLEPNGSC